MITSIYRDPWLGAILVLALVARLIFLAIYPDIYFPDAVSYRTIGKEIFSGTLIHNNIYMPLYPIWTYITGGGVTQKLADIILSTGVVFIIYLLSFELSANRLASLTASAIAALYPHFLFYAVTGLTETAYTLLLLIAFYSFYREKMLPGMIILVLALLIRPTLDLLNPVLVLVFSHCVLRVGWKQSIKNIGTYFIIYGILMTPWWIHQYIKYDTFVRLNLGHGIVLYAGNNPLHHAGGGNGGEEVDMTSFNKIKDPLERHKALKKAAIEYIIDKPGRFIQMAGVKFLRFWRLYPYTDQYQQWYVLLSSLLSYGLILFLAIGFLFRSIKKQLEYLLPILGLMAYLTLVHMVTIGSIRYRFPLEPFLIIFAAFFLIDIVKNHHFVQKLKSKVTL